MPKRLNAFHFLNLMERKYGLFELDAACREILDIVAQRQMAGLMTGADDIIQSAQMSRASVYRKIRRLCEHGSLIEDWSTQQPLYTLGENMFKFCEEIMAMNAPAQSDQ